MPLRRGRRRRARLRRALCEPIEAVIGRDDECGVELLGEIAIVAEDLIDAREVLLRNRRVALREKVSDDVGPFEVDDGEVGTILRYPLARQAMRCFGFFDRALPD